MRSLFRARYASVVILLAGIVPLLRAETELGYTFTTIAGRNNIGAVDGTGTAARFREPAGIASDKDGNLYVIDSSACVVRKITSGGTVTTLAGLAGTYGTEEGMGSSALFCFPQGIAVDGTGTIYVADSGNNAIRKITPDGFVQTFAGGRSGSQDGFGSLASFALPQSVAVDAAGTLYVADMGNHLIRKIDKDGDVTTLAGDAGVAGTEDGTGSSARFNKPWGIAVGVNGMIYVADSENHAIRKVTADGVVTTLAGLAGVNGTQDGTAGAARFNRPYGVAVDSAGNVYATDTYAGLLRKITPAGAVTTVATGFAYGRGVTVDSSTGNIFVTDTGHHLIKKVTPAGSVNVFAGADVSTGSADGKGTTAQFASPEGLVMAGNGELFVADSNGHVIRKVDPNRLVTTWAGNVIHPGYGTVDGFRTSAAFANPTGLAIDANGNLFVADSNSTIRKIDPTGNVTTIAGAHQVTGNADGPGGAARFYCPEGVAVDQQGNLYVADSSNRTIRKIDPAGQVTTPFGKSGASGWADGVGNEARFALPMGLAFDPAGNLYVADVINNSIRKIAPDGMVTTLAGDYRHRGNVDGKGREASFTDVAGVAVDRNGVVFVTDAAAHLIRKITPDGTVTTIGGLAGQRGVADGTGSAARFNRPWGITLDRWGFLYVSDSINNTIRKGIPAGAKSPSFPQSPSSTAVGAGHTIELKAAAQGLPAPIVYWMRQPAGGNGFSPLKESDVFKGVNTPTLTIATVGAEMNGDQYVCMAENGIDMMAYSKPATLTVIPAPTFKSASSATFTVGAPGSFAIVATGATAFSVSAGDLPAWATLDATTGILSGTPSALAATSLTFVVAASNAAVLPTKQSFTLNISPGPVITAQPKAQTVNTSATAVLLAEVAGAAPIKLQWLKNGVPVSNSATVSGATTNLLAIGNAQLADAGSYVLEATGVNGVVVSEPAVLTIVTPPAIAVQPLGQTVADGSRVSFSVGATSATPISFQWYYNGQPITGATAAIYAITAANANWIGEYTVRVSDARTSVLSRPAILNVVTGAKLTGAGEEVGANITHPNGKVYDQVLLTGGAATLKADAGEVMRISCIDLDDDIVQIEFSGAGSINVRLDASSGPAAPLNYNQSVPYMKGHATIIIAGADETTNLSVFTVGRTTAINQALFRDNVTYDGVADIASITITSANGKFGGVYTGNASYFSAKGLTGLYAPGVQFLGPVVVGNISGADSARAVFIIGSASDVRVAGGDLAQMNLQPVQVDGLTKVKFTAGATSHGVAIPASRNRARLERDGVDLTDQVVVNPTP